MIRLKISIAAAVMASLLAGGCGKKTEEEPAAAGTAPATADTAATPEPAAPRPKAAAPASPGREVLPGSSAVRDALAQKDYENAVGALLALRGAAVASPQTEEFMSLYGEVKDTLLDASATDPKAARALAMLRAASAGR